VLQKPNFLTQLDEIYRLVRDLTINEEKKFWSIFMVRGKRNRKIFFRTMSNHVPIDRSRQAESGNVVFEALLMNIWVIYVKNSV
jgi:hypothetical protein